MTHGWSAGKLVQLARVRSGFAFKSSQWTDAGVPVVKIGNVKRGRLDMDGCSFVTEDDAVRSGFLLSDGDILVGLTGYVGEVAKVRNLGPLVLNQRVGKFYPTSDCDPEFLFFLVSNDEFRQRVEAASHGSAQANVSPSAIEAFEVLIPPLPEQRAIAATLGALDDKIELNRKMNATLEAMARALFRDWFVDFGPTRARMEGRAPYLSPDLWSLFPDRLDAEGKPEGWESGTVSDLVSFNPKESLRKGTEAPYLDMAALPTQGANHAEPIQRTFASGSKFRDGDTLLARITPCLENGKTCLVHGLGQETVAWGSTEFIVMRPRLPLPPAFGYLLARDKDFRDAAIRSMTGTSGRQRATVDAIASHPFTVPPHEAMLAFGACVNALFERIASNERESRTLAQTRDLLLPRLMSGETIVAP